MSILRDVAGGLLKMFVDDAWLTAGILLVVSLTGLLANAGAVPLLRGAILFLGSIAAVLTSVVLAARRHE